MNNDISNAKNWSDDQIISYLKKFWKCDDFVFTGEFVEEGISEKFKGRVVNVKNKNGELLRDPKSDKPLWFNVRRGFTAKRGACEIECYLANKSWREEKVNPFYMNFKFTDLQTVIWSKDLNDRYLIGEIHVNDNDTYYVKDLRRSDFSKLEGPVNLHNFQCDITIGGRAGNVKIPENHRYYKFSWIIQSYKGKQPRFYIDTSKEIVLFQPHDIVNCLRENIEVLAPGGKQKIKRSLDTLKKQLTASGKEVFIYELLQNAADYPFLGNVLGKEERQLVDVEFHITDNYLIFQHTGAYFLPRNVAAICNINDKEKADNIDAIGYKGIGFKTVFLENNYVYLRTGKFSFTFDEEVYEGIDNVPWQITPIWTESKTIAKEITEVIDSSSKDFRVQFALRPIKQSTISQGKYSFVNLFKSVFDTERVILFIPNLRNVSIYCNEWSQPIIRTKDTTKWLVSEPLVEEISPELKEFINKEIEEGDSKIPEKYKNFNKTTVKFACRIEQQDNGRKILKPVENTCLYCYLPAKKARLGFPFLMNTDMIPSGPRDDIEDMEINYEICQIAGKKLVTWLQSILQEHNFVYDSVFSLVPSFDTVVNYEEFVDRIEQGFNDALEEIPLIPVIDNGKVVQKLVSKVIYDTTGISEAGIMTDDEILNFAGWSDYFPVPALRGKDNFERFIEKYHADEQEFDIDVLLGMCDTEDFNEWLAIQDNNNKFLNFLVDKGYLEDFVDKDKAIFLGNDGELHEAYEIYDNIDKHLIDLSCFKDEYLPRLSTNTRDFFANNNEWESQIDDIFKEFDAKEFAEEVYEDQDMLSLLEEKENSVSFIHFLAVNNVDSNSIINFPFFDKDDELIDDYQRLVFFPSDRAKEVYEYEWIDNDWMSIISEDYYKNDTELCINYLKTQCEVLEYSDEYIIDRIVKDEDKVDNINSYLDDIDTALPFINFVFANADSFEDSSLANFTIIAYDKQGEKVSGTAAENTYIFNQLYEELVKKTWISYGWLYSLSEEYFKNRQETEVKQLQSFFKKSFGVKSLELKNVVEDFLLKNEDELESNLEDIDDNIEFWRWIKANCKESVSFLKDLPIIATDTNGIESAYTLSEYSIYMSDDLMPDGNAIESIVREYYEDSLFVIPRYAQDFKAGTKKEWREFLESLGVLSQQTELVFDQIIPNLSDLENQDIPSMLAQVEEFFNDNDITFADLTALRLKTRDEEYREIGDCLFVSCKKDIELPFVDIEIANECVLSDFNADTRRLLSNIAAAAGSIVIENLSDWRKAKLERYLELQDEDEITRDVHLHVAKEILLMEQNDRKDLLEYIHKILLLAKDGNFYKQEELTLGTEYKPFCDFEKYGIGDDYLTYLAVDYSTWGIEKLRKQLRDSFEIHTTFVEEDIPLLSNRKFAEFFWSFYIIHTDAPRSRIKEFIEQGKFANIECVPTPNGGMDCAENLYCPKTMSEYKALVEDRTCSYPCTYSDEANEILTLLDFKKSLSFKDGLHALQHTDNKDKRYSILEWMYEDFCYHEWQVQAVSCYRESEESKWRNRLGKKVLLKDLYALDIDTSNNSKYLEDYFKNNACVISNEYFSQYSENNFYGECHMLQIPIITWNDIVKEPILDDNNDEDLRDTLRNLLLLVAAIEKPDEWTEYYNQLCERFDALTFKRCKSISFTYKDNYAISSAVKKFHYDEDELVFYYVKQWDAKRVFKDFVVTLQEVLNCELDSDLFQDIFDTKSIFELEEFVTKQCINLADDEEFRKVIKTQLGVNLASIEEDEDDEEPELSDIEVKETHANFDEDFDDDYDEIEDDGDDDEGEDITDDSDKPFVSVDEQEEDDEIEEPEEEDRPILINLGKPTPFSSQPRHYEGSILEDFSEDDEEDDEYTTTYSSTTDSGNEEKHGAYRGQWEPAQNDAPFVRKERRKSTYAPDQFHQRSFDVGTQEPVTLSRKDISDDEVNYLSNLLGRAVNVDTIKDENYIVRMRFWNSLQEEGLEMDMSEKDYVESGSKQIRTKSGQHIHRCSARSGILYISPIVWNRLREGSWIVCFYSGKFANDFVYVRSQEELMTLINQDALVIQVTGNDKQEVVNKLYEEGFSKNLSGNIYTLIRTIKVEGEVTPFDENVSNYYSNEDDSLDIDEL